jgi:FkbM family methyltransferase
LVALGQKGTKIPAARPLLKRPRVERVVALLLRSTVVAGSARFVFRELADRRRTASYRLRGSGLRVAVRHGTGDVVTLDEVFYSRTYEFPPPVTRALESLGRPPGVVDLGANIGLFGVFVLERYRGARIVAIEADAANAAVLRRCVAANEDAGDWEVVEAVASTRDGTVDFVPGEYALSHVAAAGETGIPVRAVDIFPYLADADIVKMDIEGGEWEILGDRRLREVPARALVLEYHAYACPEPNPREAAMGALEAAGFAVQTSSGADDYGIAWAWRPDCRQGPGPTASSSSTGTSPTMG